MKADFDATAEKIKFQSYIRIKFIEKIKSALASWIKFYYRSISGSVPREHCKRKTNETLKKFHLNECMYKD